MRGLIVAIFLAAAGLSGPQAANHASQFAEDNQLLRTAGYCEWIFLSSGLGMTYRQDSHQKTPDFTNVFIRPEAYREFIRTGRFPDGTVLVLEIRRPESRASINQGGHFQSCLVGIEASVKNEERFPENWAYFTFIGRNGEALESAKAFPKETRWKCHNEHAAVDNVFVQFHPGLREAREESLAR